MRCGGKYTAIKESKVTLGTVVEITVVHPDESLARAAIAKAFAEFERIDGLLSIYRASSEVSRMNETADPQGVIVDAEVFAILRQALIISRLSEGAFDVTVGPLMDLWEFDKGGTIPTREALSATLSSVGYRKLEIDEKDGSVRFLVEGMKVDLGGIGKGYAVDRAAGKLQEAGIANAIIDAGGDLRLLGRRPGKDFWRIGVRHPREASRFLLTLDLADKAVVTSGDYERFFMDGQTRYHHILDPRTGLPERKCQSVTVIAPETVDADAYATAAFVLGPRKGLEFLRKLPGVEGVIVDAEGVIHWTDRLALGQ